jgi:hypothetical protein
MGVFRWLNGPEGSPVRHGHGYLPRLRAGGGDQPGRGLRPVVK